MLWSWYLDMKVGGGWCDTSWEYTGARKARGSLAYCSGLGVVANSLGVCSAVPLCMHSRCLLLLVRIGACLAPIVRPMARGPTH
jgi:hypothetical protein